MLLDGCYEKRAASSAEGPLVMRRWEQDGGGKPGPMADFAQGLTQESAQIFRITHRANLPWILANGLHCATSAARDPGFVPIGNVQIIDRRTTHRLRQPFPGVLADYIPFYFTPFSPMFLNIKSGWRVTQRSNSDIAIIVSSLRKIHGRATRFVFSDRHALLNHAEFFDDLACLDRIDWAALQARRFKRNPDDPDAFERYEAEALIYRHLPADQITAVFCYDEETTQALQEEARRLDLLSITIATERRCYF